MKASALKQKKKRGALLPYAFLLPSLLGVTVFVLIPFADVLRRSFFEPLGEKFVWFQNYIQLFQNEAFQLAAKNTVKFTVVGLPLLLLLSLLLAAVLNSIPRFGEYFKTVLLTPMAVPVASAAILWQIFFHQYGLLNSILEQLGMTAVDFLHSDKAFSVLIFTYLWKNVGYDMVLWLAGLTGIPKELYEAAEMDGAGTKEKFFYITLPCLRSTFFITAVLSLVNSFKVFREAYLIAGPYPHQSIYMLQHIFNNWFYKLELQKLCTAAALMALVIPAVIALIRKLGGDKEDI